MPDTITPTPRTPEVRPAPERVRRPSGRSLGVHTLARGSSGRTVVWCHAAPGSGGFDPDPDASGRCDVTIIAIDRPGYGASDPVPEGEWASVDAAADDVAWVLDARGDAHVGVGGWSAGGRVALALAARRPDLVERVAVVGTPAPNDQVAWIPPEQAEAMEGLRTLPPESVHTILGDAFSSMIPLDPFAPEALGLLEAGPADDAALAVTGARARLGHMLEAAFAQGATGLAADVAGYGLRPWGFEPADVRARTLLLYGDADPVTGPRHAAWWQRALPNARTEMVPGAGHLAIVPMWRRILSHLAPGSLRSTRRAT